MSLVSGPLVGWLAGLLLHAVWIAAAAAALSWIVLRRTRDPHAAHGAAASALLLVVAGMLAVSIATWPGLGDTPAVAWVHTVGTARLAPTMASALTPVMAPVAAGRVSEAETDWRAWLVLAWGCGVLAMSLRHACGWWQALRLRRTAVGLAGELADRLAELCRSAGSAAPLLLASTRIAVPAAIGWWRPAILVPVGLLTGLTPAQVDALLLHELAHLCRQDWLMEMAVSLLESLLFFHPAVWWLGRRLRQARELCCDSQAVRYGAEPDSLARALFALAERTAPGSPLLAASGGILADRVRRLLGLPERRERPWRALAAIALLPLLLVAIVSCARIGTPETPTAQMPAAPARTGLFGDEPDPAYPLARRIRAHVDGRQVQITARAIAAPSAFWAELGLAGEQAQILDRATADRVLAAATTDPRAKTLTASRLVTFGLQRGRIGSLEQHRYRADYRLDDGRLEPVESVLSYGSSFRCCAEPVADGVVLAEAGAIEVDLVGSELLSFPWPIDGVEQPFALEQPVLLVDEGWLPADTRLGPGEVVAMPLTARVQRPSPQFRQVREHGTIFSKRIADPDLQARPRRIYLISAEPLTNMARTDPDEGKSMLTATPAAAAWLDGTRLNLDLRDAPLEEAVRSVAAQLPVPVEIMRDADYAATRVSLSAHDEPAREVLVQLLRQTMLEGGVATAGLLRLKADTASYSQEQARDPAKQDAAFETLPGLAWESPQGRLYDIRDLMLPQATKATTTDQNGWTIAVNQEILSSLSRLFRDGPDAAALLRQGICTSTWSDERSIAIKDGHLIVQAAPAVHRAIEAELSRRRSASDKTHLRIELLRLRPEDWRALNLEGMTDLWGAQGIDEAMHRRIAAAAETERPAACEVVLSDGTRVDIHPRQASWWAGIALNLQSALSPDRGYISLTVRISRWDVDGAAQLTTNRTSMTLPDGGAALIALPHNDALPHNNAVFIVSADAVISDPIGR
jgi:beta-lactamase regulating signal transducer with metallopeptidase domain